MGMRATLAEVGQTLAADEEAQIRSLIATKADLLKAMEGESAARELKRQQIDEEDRQSQQARLSMSASVEDLEEEIALMGLAGDERAKQVQLLDMEQTMRNALKGATQEQMLALEELHAKYKQLLDKAMELDLVKQSTDAIGESFGQAFESMVMGATSAKDALKSFASAIIKELLQVLVIKQMVAAISGGLSSVFSAKGNAFDQGKVIPYASGGVVNRPTAFPMSGGNIGVMGEAGPEAIMPLKRGPGGKLGVMAAGGQVSKVVNVKFNIKTRDADSFRKSSGQITADINRAVRGV